jgi:hypothetical protein
MKVITSPPQRGDFLFQQLAAPCQVSGEILHDTRGFFGLLLNKSIPTATVRDEQGNIYSFVRSVWGPNATTSPTTFIYESTLVDGKTLRLDRERMAARAQTVTPVSALEGDEACWRSQPADPGSSWELRASENGILWREDDLLEMKGRLLGNGLQWYLPGRDWGTYYIQQFFAIDGFIEGRPVKGLMSLDQVYMAEGGAVHHKKDLVVNNQQHILWWAFANVYEDGCFDAGSFMVGHDNLGFGIIINEKSETRITTDIEGIVTHRQGSYFCQSARVTLDGKEEWEFLPDPKGEMIDFVGGFPVTAQQEGRWRRVGDARVPERWYAWGETDRRNGSARNVFGSDL